MLARLRQTIKKLLPFELVAYIRGIRWWRVVEQVHRKTGMRDFCLRIISAYGTTVQHGPFKGLKFTHKGLLVACNTSGLLGCYERELQPWILALSGSEYERVIDIGAAEGYYAVGIALRNGIRVDAYDTAPTARRLCRAMAKLNGVSSLVQTHGFCSPKILQQLSGHRCFILSDCEGFEVQLFSGEVIQALAQCDLLIELHNGTAPAGTTRELLKSRFAATHQIEVVRFGSRELKDFPELAYLGKQGIDVLRAIREEGRGDQEWLIANSRSRLVVKRPALDRGQTH
jgi:hypothetical protein